MELHAVESKTTSPHVRVVDIDLSFRKKWTDAIDAGLNALRDQLEGKTRLLYKRHINVGVDGWSESYGCGHDGYLLLRTRRRFWWRQGKTVLRITGVSLGFNNEHQPTAVDCLLYEPELTEEVREMLASIGRAVGATHTLTVHRMPHRTSWVGLYWHKH